MVNIGGRMQCFVAALSWALLGPAVAQVENVSRPTWRPGTVFHYERFDQIRGEVTEAEEQKVLSSTGDEAELAVVAKSGAKETRKANVGQHGPMSTTRCFVTAMPECKGALELIRFPAKPGDKWKYKFEFPSATSPSERITWDMAAEVERWEEVKVPAGTFSALRIEHDGYWERTDGQRGRVEVLYWYVPEIGRVVKLNQKLFNRVGWIDSRVEVRLVKYVPATPEAKKD